MLSQSITLITGSRKGIGKAIAEYYLAQGHIVIGCSRQPADIQHDRYTHFCGDVADEKFVQEMMRTIRKDFGRLDNLVNNAGIASMNHFLLTPRHTVERVFQTNFMGTFLLCREASKLMSKNKYGRIVNFATVAIPLKVKGEAIYAASKAAVVTLTEILAQELGEMGITVNAVGPTPVETDLICKVPKQKIDELLEKQAIHRFGNFADVINVMDFFLNPNSSFVTGQTLYLGGVS
jgi:3-oxoacyl-[acyl-carrier protein] reductase